MLQRDRSGPQIRDKDNNPNQRKHVSDVIFCMASKMSMTGEFVKGSSTAVKKENKMYLHRAVSTLTS